MGSLRGTILSVCLGAGLLSGGLTAEAKPDTLYFSDVHTSHWSYDCLETVINQKHWMTGYKDHTFKGDWPVTRYVLASTLLKAVNALQGTYRFDLHTTERPQESGVPQHHWARPAVQTMVSDYRLMGTYPAGFMGEKTVTRQELARILGHVFHSVESQNQISLGEHRRLSQKAIDLDNRSMDYPMIQKVVDQYQLMDIYRDHTFRPNDPVTRYELATVLCRINAYAQKRPHAS